MWNFDTFLEKATLTFTCSPTWKLSKPVSLGYGGFITQEKLLNHWPLVIELSLQCFSTSQRAGGETESSNPLITGWFSWQLAPILKHGPKVTLLT